MSTSMERETLVTISPTTNQPILTRYGPSDKELALLVQRARRAFGEFSAGPPAFARHQQPQQPQQQQREQRDGLQEHQSPPPPPQQQQQQEKLQRGLGLKERQEIVARALELLKVRREELGRELTEQMGRPIAYTAKEITTAIARAEYLLRISDDALAVTPGEEEVGYQRYIKKEPVGVVLVIFAWNYPYLILVNSLIPALLAGNSVILKPSPQTPTIVEHIQRIFLEAGLPENVIQYLHCGSPARLESFIQRSAGELGLVSFTGSVAGGHAVQRAVASAAAGSGAFTPVCLELGGKDPAYVREDVDVRWAAAELVDGALFNSGQSCCSVERVYVHERVHDAFVAAVQQVLRGYRLGDPRDPATQLGPVVSRRAADTVRRHVADALARGAVDATPADNDSFRQLPATDGNYVAPVLLTHVRHDMAVMTEETFGPVIPVMKVRDDDEAVRLMNDSEFGLTASVWTRDLVRAEELVSRIEAGTVFVNRCDFPSPDLAWTGWKSSGRGVTLSRYGFEQFTRLRSVHIKAHPFE